MSTTDNDQLEKLSHAATGSFLTQVQASIRKNVQQKRRTPISCCLETLLPVIFILGSVGIWAAVGGTETEKGDSYLNYNKPYNNFEDLLPKGVCYDEQTASTGVPEAFSALGLLPCTNLTAKLKEMDDDSIPTDLVCPGRTHNIPIDGMCHVEGFPFMAYNMLNTFDNAKKLPSLDFIILLRWMMRTVMDDDKVGFLESMKTFTGPTNAIHFTIDEQKTTNGHDLIRYLNESSHLFHFSMGKVFSTHDEAEDYIVDSDNLGKTWFMVVVDGATPSLMDVTLRFNRSSTFWTNKDMLYKENYMGGSNNDQGHEILYYMSGFLTLNQMVTDWYTSKQLAVAPAEQPAEPVFTFQSNPEWTDYIFLARGSDQGYFELFMVFAYLYPVSQFTKSLVTEKELRVREAMMIMGLGHGSFYISWFSTYSFEVIVSSIINMLMTKATYWPRSDPAIIFFLFFFFGISCICLSFLISTIFSKARSAALVSPLLFFVLSVPMFMLSTAPAGLKGMMSLLSPSAMALGMKNMAKHEMAGGMGPKQMVSEMDDVNMATVLFMLIVDSVLYTFLALYLDAVFPSEWGTKKHPLFCILDPIAWCMNKTREASSDDGHQYVDSRDPKGVYEDDSASPNPVVVRLKSLKKEFTRGDETFAAVNNLCMHMRENEITVLLGHNGAGKTTTMNMMTGMLDITGGDCMIYGNSVRHDLAKVRHDISLCPQHNILWPELTCRDHLLFFAAIKAVPKDKRDEEVDQMLHDVDLFDKRDQPAGSLSGGQKRKLSVAIAFIGNSKLVFLDEPTAGMDVAARRFTWDLIKRQSKGRAVLLTTHFMDEADLLGHTISIMSKGMLKCSGSPMFLKSRLGVGYSITLAVDPQREGATEPARKLITSHIPDAVPMSTGAAEVAYRLPMESSSQFPALLSQLEANGKSIGVNGFGITVTTLEEIFLKIAEADDAHAATPTDNGPATSIKQSQKHIWTQDEQEKQDSGGKSRVKLDLFMQFNALLVKRFHNSRRDRRTQILQVLLPVVAILLSFLLGLVEFIEKSPKTYFHPKMYEIVPLGDFVIPLGNCEDVLDTDLLPERMTLDKTVTVPHNTSTNTAITLDELVLRGWNEHEDIWRFHSIYCNDEKIGPVYFNESTAKNYSVLFFNASGFHTQAEVLHYYRSVAARTLLKKRSNGTSLPEMKLATDNLPWTKREQAVIENIKTFMIGMFVMIPFTLIPSTFVSWVVKEKECKAKHLQFVSGMNYWVYWLSNLVFDMVSFLVTETLVIIIFLAFNRDEYIGGADEFGATFLLILFFGLAGISTSYVWGFFFKEHPTAQNVVMLGNFICGFLLVIVTFMLKIFDSTKSEAEVLAYIFRIVPSFCLGDGIINLASLGFSRGFGIEKSAWDMDVTGYDILYMAIEFPVFFLIALVLDHPNRKKKQQQLFHEPDVIPPPIPDEDIDVQQERARVEQGQSAVPTPPPAPGQREYYSDAKLLTPVGEARGKGFADVMAPDLVTVKHLCKIYDNKKTAVKNLSFGVKKGEVFGFLGTNGAGKTTTISILCGEKMPTHGRAYIDGFDVVDEAIDAQRHIGYCPQFDALLDLLTPKEHLKLYAGLRGIPSDRQEGVIDTLIDVCGLTEHQHAVAMNLSGGNKRKLSVALSLVGGPLVVFLDEPSAGMDPVARRGLWEVINDISSHCSVVLTTHHLEEVEALAHRVAIMVDGQMMCIGDKTHLKNKFGSGFEMQIRVNSDESVKVLENYVARAIPDALLSEYRSLKFHYELPPTTKLSKVFHELESMKEKLGITDYAVSQTSIESVFLRISESAEAAEEAKQRAKEEKQLLGLKIDENAEVEMSSTPTLPLSLTNRTRATAPSAYGTGNPISTFDDHHAHDRPRQATDGFYNVAASGYNDGQPTIPANDGSQKRKARMASDELL